MSSTLIVLPFGLIGDTIGAEPAITAYARKEKAAGNETFVLVHYDGRPVLELSAAYQRNEWRFADWKGDGLPYAHVKQINLPKVANTLGHKHYMSAAYFDCLGLPVPKIPPRPELYIDKEAAIAYDYGLAPFARSLGVHEKWPRGRWQELVESMPDKTFVLYGAKRRGDKSDPDDFLHGKNVEVMFDYPLDAVCASLSRLRHGLISVSTGLSHLAFATGAKNWLLINQGNFAKNPEGITLQPLKNPEQVSLEEVRGLLNA